MAAPAPEVRWMQPEALKALMDRMQAVTIVDVREPAAFFSSPLTILGAMKIAPGAFAHRWVEIPRDDPVILFGADPHDPNGPRCANLLAQHSYPDVSVLQGGWNGWISRDYPTMPRGI